MISSLYLYLKEICGFLGFNGGELGQMCDYSMIVESPKGVYGPVEDLHLIFNHLISLWLQSK